MDFILLQLEILSVHRIGKKTFRKMCDLIFDHFVFFLCRNYLQILKNIFLSFLLSSVCFLYSLLLFFFLVEFRYISKIIIKIYLQFEKGWGGDKSLLRVSAICFHGVIGSI